MAETLHVADGWPASVAVLARAAEAFRTERVAYGAYGVLAYLAYLHPEAASTLANAVVCVALGVAGRSALHAWAGVYTPKAQAS